MISQGGSKHMFLKQIKKTFSRHPEAFWKYAMASDIVSQIVPTSISESVTRSVSDSKESNKLVQFLESNGPTFNLS